MNDKDSVLLARWVRYFLLLGVGASAILIMAGIPKTIFDRRNGMEAVRQPSLYSELAKDALEGKGEAILRVGLLILMSTPIARVLVLAVGWGAHRDFRMMAVALSVLILLVLSVILGVRA